MRVCQYVDPIPHMKAGIRIGMKRMELRYEYARRTGGDGKTDDRLRLMRSDQRVIVLLLLMLLLLLLQLADRIDQVKPAEPVLSSFLPPPVADHPSDIQLYHRHHDGAESSFLLSLLHSDSDSPPSFSSCFVFLVNAYSANAEMKLRYGNTIGRLIRRMRMSLVMSLFLSLLLLLLLLVRLLILLILRFPSPCSPDESTADDSDSPAVAAADLCVISLSLRARSI